jgi:subtilase family serine protease
MRRRSRLAVRPNLEFIEARLVLSTTSTVAVALTPAQIDSAYGLSAVTYSSGTVKGDGEGQTIAIIDAYNDPTIVSDLDKFDSLNGLTNPTSTSTPASNSATSTSTPSITVDDLAGSSTNSGWAMETALDVEMAHAAAPGANIVLVEASSATTSGLVAAVQAAEKIAGVSVISMSWGASEFSGETSLDSTFTTPSGHTPITFVASSGDSGAGTEWPAVSPNVVGVGGTTLTVSSTGAIASQSTWTGSGGGVSTYESKPVYQDSAVSGTKRESPDVAIDANPSSGVVIVSQGQQTQVGGTSLGSPVFAGLVAIADQGLSIAGKTTLSSTQTLNDLYSAPTGSFSDVTTGSGATTGYDTVTGLGSPNATTLISDITGTSTTTTTGTGTTGTTGTGTTGSTGTTGTGSGTTTTGTGSGSTGSGTTGTGGSGTTGGTGSAPTKPSRPPYAPPPPPWWAGGGFFRRGF